jgi:thiol-disulfide isomerase/thioredoxin
LKNVLAIIKKIIPASAFLFIVNIASAQRIIQFVSGSISEKSLVDLELVQVVNNISYRVAEYKISPNNRDFAFAIPGETGATYRLQVNIMKMDGRHPKVDKGFSLPLLLVPGQNYTMNITPSKLSETKKTGWDWKQETTGSTVALFTGKILNFALRSGMEISLQKVEDGALVQQTITQTKADGSFIIACPIKKQGFYYLTTPRYRVRVYLKPSDRIELNVDHKTGYVATLNGSRENKTLYHWQQLIQPITAYGYNLGIVNTDSVELDEYIRRYEALSPAMDNFLSKTDKTNPHFTKALKNAMDVDRQLAPIYFLLHKSAKKVKGYQPAPRDFNEVPAFYKRFIQPANFSNASILAVGEARLWMNLNARLSMSLLPEEKRENLSQSERINLMMNTVSNDTLKTFFFNDQMEQIEVNNLSEFKETFEPFKKYARNSPAKETYKNIYALYIDDTSFVGKSSYNFSLPDSTGKMVSMKDFKGKVVLIDVWATWCGPCKAQFPFLKEIEHEYANNKDLVFVGISLDKLEVKQKWMAMIKKEKLGGIQLLDDFGKSFGRKYDLTAIPRFMLIDRQGRWIEIRCPRPEAKGDLKRYLDKALGETGLTKK